MDTSFDDGVVGDIGQCHRPLVMLKIEDGRLPFRQVGTERLFALKDVLDLKVKEERQNCIMLELFAESEALDVPSNPC